MKLVLGLRRHWEPNGRPWAWLFGPPLHCWKAQKAWLSPSFTRACIYQDNSGYTYSTCCIFFECFLAEKHVLSSKTSRPRGPTFHLPTLGRCRSGRFLGSWAPSTTAQLPSHAARGSTKGGTRRFGAGSTTQGGGRWDGEWEGVRIFRGVFAMGGRILFNQVSI